MFQFFVKTLIVCGLVGVWCGFVLSEFGPAFEQKHRVRTTESPPLPPVDDGVPRGMFGSGVPAEPDVVEGP